MPSHGGAHPYGRSTDRARRASARRARSRRLRMTQLIVFSILVIVVVGVGWYAWGRLLSPSPDELSAAQTTAPSTAENGILCPEPGALPAEPASVHVRVLNGTGRAGLAGKVSKHLDARGYQTGKAGNTSDAHGPVLIVHGPQGYLQARSVAAQFSDSTFRVDDRQDTDVDVLIGKRDVSLTSKKNATATLKKPVPAPKGCAAG